MCNTSRSTRLLVQIIDVLRDDHHRTRIVRHKPRQCQMGRVRLCRCGIHPPRVVEVVHLDGIGGKALGRGHFRQIIAGPGAALVAKRAKTAFGGHAGTCQHYDLTRFRLFHVPVSL